LGPVGPRYGFVRFERPGAEVSTPPKDRGAEILSRFNELLSTPPPLPPPPQAEIISVDVKRELTGDDITSYKFECPSCHDGELLLCPEYHQFSCRGGKDSQSRYMCRWCGETLVTKPLTPEEAAQPRPPVLIEGQQKTLKVRFRELKAGGEAQ